MTVRQTDGPAVSAAKASISTATGYRCEQNHRLPSSYKKVRGRRRPDPLGDRLRSRGAGVPIPYRSRATGVCCFGLIIDTIDLAGTRTRSVSHESGPPMIGTITKPKIKDEIKDEIKVERPRLHKVILVNDDFTLHESVVTVLKGKFRMSEAQALRAMMTAHRRGTCAVAVYTMDLADAKATNATDAGRRKGYPLLFTTGPEE